MSTLSFFQLHSVRTHKEPQQSHPTSLHSFSIKHTFYHPLNQQFCLKLPTGHHLNSAPQSSKCRHSRIPSTTFPHLSQLPLSRRHQQRCLPSSHLDKLFSTSTQITADPPTMTRPMLWKHGPGTLPIADNVPAHTRFSSWEEPFARKDNKGPELWPIIFTTKTAMPIPL